MIVLLLFVLGWQVNADPRSLELRRLRQRVQTLEAALRRTADALETSTGLSQRKKQQMVDSARIALQDKHE